MRHMRSSELGIGSLVEPEVLADVMLGIYINPAEISGFARVIKDGNIYTIKQDVMVFEQYVSGVHTELTPEARHKWNMEMIKSSRGAEINDFRLWWHSHVDGPVGFSGTDEGTIDSFKDEIVNPWWMSLVGNKFGHFVLRLDVFKPERQVPILIDDLSFTRPTTKKDMRALMLARHDQMLDLIRKKVFLGAMDEKPFEKILKGVFGE